jgi:hypothetical protein
MKSVCHLPRKFRRLKTVVLDTIHEEVVYAPDACEATCFEKLFDCLMGL